MINYKPWDRHYLTFSSTLVLTNTHVNYISIYIYKYETKQSVWNSQHMCERLFDNSLIYICLHCCCLVVNLRPT